jgi:putative membrane protein
LRHRSAGCEAAGTLVYALVNVPVDEVLMKLLVRWLINAIGLWMATMIIPGVAASGWQPLLAAALLLGLVNALVRPVLVLLTLPITLVTLGLFLVVINAGLLLLVAWLVPGFSIAGLFWAGVLAALWMSLFSLSTQWAVRD